MPVKAFTLIPFLKSTLCLLFVMMLLPGACLPALGQQPAEHPDRARALALYESSNYIEAVPLLEKVAAASPNDVVVLSRLGFALYASSTTMKDKAARKAALDRARQILTRSVELGDDSNLTRVTLESLASPDPTDAPFSNLREAEKAIREGEDAFVRGELDKALAAYQRALKLDPKLYEAALYAGDMYFKKGHGATDQREKSELMDQAGVWFAKAAEINPDRETAHRYWGDALMEQNKREESHQKFIEAIVAAPYYQRSWVGLTQWADRYGVALGHPRIDVPTNVSPLKDDKMTITIDPKSLNDDADGSAAWMLYGLTRAHWATEKFAKEYPKEKSYRHSLSEESEALINVVQAVKQQQKDGKVKQLDPMLARLLQLHDDGLVDAYILFARVDRGIAEDYPAYRKANRDKLRRYLLKYVSRGE